MKILLCNTPHPKCANLGDHAQAIEIKKWLARYWPGVPVLEFDRKASLRDIHSIISDRDVIFLQSGGNMARRARQSEPMRRKIVASFPNQPIVQLPQTVAFRGQEIEQARRAYAKHRQFIFVARDSRSLDVAGQFLPSSIKIACPDFALRRPPQPATHIQDSALLILRSDSESIIDRTAVERLYEKAKQLDLSIEELDTEIKRTVWKRKREALVSKLIARISRHRLVITDRLHGMIFSVLARRPVICLPTVDVHKTRGFDRWFENVSGVFFTEPDEAAETIERAIDSRAVDSEDWEGRYFKPLAEQVQKALNEVALSQGMASSRRKNTIQGSASNGAHPVHPDARHRGRDPDEAHKLAYMGTGFLRPPEQEMRLSIVLTNYRRPINLIKIIDKLVAQSVVPQILVWDNSPKQDFQDHRASWIVRSSLNLKCTPRWWVGAQAITEWTIIMDDDLVPADDAVLEDTVNKLAEYSPKPIGATGVKLKAGRSYGRSQHIGIRRRKARKDIPVDIIKGRFFAVKTARLRELPLHLHEEDDIAVSALLGGGMIASCLQGRFKELPTGNEALERRQGHYELREAARQQFFKKTELAEVD